MSSINDYTKAYATHYQISIEQAKEHKMVQLVQAYYEEVESIIVNDVPIERKCDS